MKYIYCTESRNSLSVIKLIVSSTIVAKQSPARAEARTKREEKEFLCSLMTKRHTKRRSRVEREAEINGEINLKREKVNIHKDAEVLKITMK